MSCPVLPEVAVDRIAQAVQRQEVHFLDARGALVRHADVHRSRQRSRELAARCRPVSTITVISCACASTAASTLAELPLVLMAHQHVAGRAQRLHLLGEKIGKS